MSLFTSAYCRWFIRDSLLIIGGHIKGGDGWESECLPHISWTCLQILGNSIRISVLKKLWPVNCVATVCPVDHIVHRKDNSPGTQLQWYGCRHENENQVRLTDLLIEVSVQSLVSFSFAFNSLNYLKFFYASCSPFLAHILLSVYISFSL